MAKDSKNGLYLPLRIDLDAWEESLSALDAPVQKKMRELRAEVRDLDLRYKVEISGAKAAGDQLRVAALESAKLTQELKLQTAAVNGLTAAYQKQVAKTGENSKEAKALAKELAYAKIKANELQVALNNRNTGFTDKLLDGVSRISPTFQKVTTAISGLGGQFAGLAVPIGIAAAAAAGLYAALEKIYTGSIKAAQEAAKTQQGIADLMRETGTTGADADGLADTFAAIGLNANEALTPLIKINKQIKDAGGKENEASKTLARWGVELANANGEMKPYLDQLAELSKAYTRAAQAGQAADFVVEVLGARGKQLAPLLANFDKIQDGLGKLGSHHRLNTQLAEDIRIVNGLLENTKGHIDQLQGRSLMQGEFERLNKELETAQKHREWLESYESGGFAKYLDNEAAAVRNLNTAIQDFKKNNQGTMHTLEKAQSLTKTWFLNTTTDALKNMTVADWVNPIAIALRTVKSAYVGARDTVMGVDRNSNEQIDAMGQQMQAEQQAVMEGQKAITKAQADAAEKQNKEAEEKAKKQADAQQKLQKELLKQSQTAYEREIQAIEDEKNAYIQAGADKLQAEELFARKKADIDSKYTANYQKEVEAAKRAQDAVTAVFMTETQKRINEIKKQEQAWVKAGASEVEAARAAQKQIAEIRMSEAERTLQENVKLIRRIQIEQAKGGDWQSRVRDYADAQYKRRTGINDGIISTAQAVGIDTIKELAAARDRVLAGFAGDRGGGTKIEAPINISFDNVVTEDMGTIERLANKVSDAIVPAIRRAINDAGAGNYVY